MTKFTSQKWSLAFRKAKWMTPVWFDVKEVEKPNHLKIHPYPE